MRWQTLWEGRWIFGALIGAGVLCALFFHWGLIVVGLLILFCLNFFRDPERAIPQGEGIICSPADGMVTEIAEKDEDEVNKQRLVRISIFLSVFNVHVNRAPVAGTVSYIAHREGDYLDARDPQCSDKNEAMTWAFDTSKGERFVVRQITGAIARRIVPWSALNEKVSKGHRFGMIRFGSRTEIYLPAGYMPKVKVGDSVKGGLDVVAEWVETTGGAE